MMVAETRIVNCGDDTSSSVCQVTYHSTKRPMGLKDGMDVGMCVIKIIKK